MMIQISVDEKKARLNRAKKLLEHWGIEKEYIESADPSDILATASIIDKLLNNEFKLTDIVDLLVKLQLRISCLERMMRDAS